MEDMDAALWGGLPSEMEERVLSYLSAPVLCRFRTVCKRWNSLIKSPEFGALCIRHAPQDASFLVRWRYTKAGQWESDSAGYDWPWLIRGQRHGWTFLDMRARRWHTIAEATNRELFQRYDLDKCKCCVVMDGGLVCDVFRPTHKNAWVLVAHTESNMLATPMHRLDAVVDMIVGASACCSYTVFVLPSGWKLVSKEENPFMVIYESRTHAWRSSSLPLITAQVSADANCVYHSILCFSSFLLVSGSAAAGDALLRDDTQPERLWIWRYNHVEDNQIPLQMFGT